MTTSMQRLASWLRTVGAALPLAENRAQMAKWADEVATVTPPAAGQVDEAAEMERFRAWCASETTLGGRRHGPFRVGLPAFLQGDFAVWLARAALGPLASEARAVTAPAWRPIETAPKGVVLIHYLGMTFEAEKRYGRRGEPDQENFVWRDECSGHHAYPKHWMPRLAAPTGAAHG